MIITLCRTSKFSLCIFLLSSILSYKIYLSTCLGLLTSPALYHSLRKISELQHGSFFLCPNLENFFRQQAETVNRAHFICSLFLMDHCSLSYSLSEFVTVSGKRANLIPVYSILTRPEFSIIRFLH